MSSVVTNVVPFARLRQEATFPALAAAYAKEAALPGLPPPCPDVERYQALEDAGVLHILGAWQGEVLIGFLSLLVAVLPHYSEKVATVESFFVAAEARNTGAAFALIHASYALARQQAAVGMFFTAAVGSTMFGLMRANSVQKSHEVFFKPL